MKPCTNALYVSLISRCDSAAIVPNTSDDLPDPETPVNTVRRRLGISRLTSFRLLTRAPWTRIRSWRSAACEGEESFAVMAMERSGKESSGGAIEQLDQAGAHQLPAVASATSILLLREAR